MPNAGLAALLCAACGSGQARPSTAAAREWRSNARGALVQLQQDIAATALGGRTEAAAARALANTSDLFGLLVAYSDLGGCRKIIVATTAPPPIALSLARPCAHLERAAALFSRATVHSDPAALVSAGREARLAEPQIVSALADLHRRR
jgi:hypothetical protein